MASRRESIGRYRLVGTLNEGATSVVHMVRDRGVERLMALKVMTNTAAAEPAQRAAFIARARAIRRLATDRVVPIHDICTHQRRPFYVMDYYPRGSLAARLVEMGRTLRVDEGLALAQELSLALRGLHHNGEIHGNLAPSNCAISEKATGTRWAPRGLLASDEELFLFDLGVDLDSNPEYISPEQRTAPTLNDPRIDVYAASAMVVGAISGVAPTPINNLGDLPFDLATLASTGPLAASLGAGLSANPQDRPDDIMAWYSALMSRPKRLEPLAPPTLSVDEDPDADPKAE